MNTKLGHGETKLESRKIFMYTYSAENAKIYSQLGIVGTTYEVSFNEMAKSLGKMQGKTVLDYGTGRGRSARLLQTLGAQRVIGVDHDHNMINQARINATTGIEFQEINNGKIPLPDNSVDVAISAHVFVEMKTIEEMNESAREIIRVLKPGGTFLVISTSPASIGHEYVSYQYKKRDGLQSGDPITCVIKGKKTFEIDDTYWTEQDYHTVLENAGLREIVISYPTAEGLGWLEESQVAPDIVLKGIK